MASQRIQRWNLLLMNTKRNSSADALSRMPCGPDVEFDRNYSDFQDFCTRHGIIHKFSPPHHPESNTLAERFVQSFKSSISKSMDAGANLDNSMYDFLISYRSSPSILGKSPSEMMHGRQLRNELKVYISTPSFDKFCSPKFKADQLVWARAYGPSPSWKVDKVMKQIGSRLYLVESGNDICTRHQNQLKLREIYCKTNNDSQFIKLYDQLPKGQSADKEIT